MRAQRFADGGWDGECRQNVEKAAVQIPSIVQKAFEASFRAFKSMSGRTTKFEELAIADKDLMAYGP